MLRTCFSNRAFALVAALATVFLSTTANASTKAARVPEPCRGALPLSLEEPTYGYATARQPVLYALEVTAQVTVVVEAHASGIREIVPEIRLLDPSCQPPTGLFADSPLPSMRGRLVRRIEEPGTYFVEVAAAALNDRRFRVDAWRVFEKPSVRLLKDGTTGETTTGEPDPDSGGGDVPPPPVDEWEELRTPSSWPVDGGLSFHDWCPLAERPELLATFTCARHLHLDSPGSATVRRLFGGEPEIVRVELATSGWLAVDGGPVTVYDARGRLAAELTLEVPERLDAGLYFLHMSSDRREIRLDVELE